MNCKIPISWENSWYRLSWTTSGKTASFAFAWYSSPGLLIACVYVILIMQYNLSCSKTIYLSYFFASSFILAYLSQYSLGFLKDCLNFVEHINLSRTRFRICNTKLMRNGEAKYTTVRAYFQNPGTSRSVGMRSKFPPHVKANVINFP